MKGDAPVIGDAPGSTLAQPPLKKLKFDANHVQEEAIQSFMGASSSHGGQGGGGRVDMAQSGGSLPENSPLAIESLKKYIDSKF